MTAVCYTIGNFSTTSYAKAIVEQEKTGKSLVTHYVPIPDTTPLDERSEELRQIRVAHWYGKKESRA